MKSCVFKDIEKGAHALDLLSYLSDEGFLEGLEALPEARLMAFLTALIDRKPPLPAWKGASHPTHSTSWSDDIDEHAAEPSELQASGAEFGHAGAAAELQASGETEDQFDADDLF